MATDYLYSFPNNRKVSRRKFLGLSAYGLAGIGVSAALFSTFSCDRKGSKLTNNNLPNILILVADDAGWHDVGYHGSEIKTPNIDKLAREGVALDQFYVCPTCSPTRASLLTGRPPSRFGILGPIAGKSSLALPQNTVTLAELLRQQGYTTGITGKWHLGLRPEVGPQQYGFEFSYGYLHGQIDQYTHHYKNGDQSWHRNGEFIEETGHATDLITHEAIRFIREFREKAKPFFLYVPFSVPHYPLQEPDEWVIGYKDSIDNDSRRAYAASMTHMDDAIGRLVSTLVEESLEKQTLVIFFSDNGGQKSWRPTFEYNLEHGPNDQLGNNQPLRGWKGELYEGGVRVPAVLNWPGTLKPRRASEVISVSDILPTLATLVGATISSDMNLEGINIWPAIADNSAVSERILYWRTNKQLALRKGDWKLIHHGKSLEEGKDELFHLAQDPYEQKDLAAENTTKLSDLREELANQFNRDPVLTTPQSRS